ncbi:C-_U-editing enzyme APOBEC-1-like [Rhinophrynus dorsalis]
MIHMNPQTFISHYAPSTYPPATHLCYEVYKGRNIIACGHLTNTSEDHAEEVFIGERFRREWRSCTVVWYISWSPCDQCMEIPLRSFLRANPNLTLQIKFAKVYKHTSRCNIRELQERGVEIGVMDLQGKYCPYNI